jgi:hypothetical protein
MDNLMNTVKQRATEQLDTQKARATDGLSTIASAVRHTTEQLRNDQHESLAQYVDRAADQLERFSTAIREKDVDQLLRDARGLARRQPALFIGGSFAVGLLAARFIKSSPRDGHGDGAGMRGVATDDSSATYPVRDSVADDMSAWSNSPAAPDREQF